MSLPFTPLDEIAPMVARLRNAFDKDKVRPLDVRRALIRQVMKLVDDNEATFCAAAHDDLGKPPTEFKLMELDLVKNECVDMLNNLAAWTGPQPVHKSGIEKLDTAYVQQDPLGTTLIIGAWNYPIQLTLVGLVGALAGGNTCMIKPSEVSPHTAKLLANLIPKYFDSDVVAVVNGAVSETTEVLACRFDHILYTGNSRVARIVMSAAAKNLTPVTLELGGKSPCVVHESSNLSIAAQRILWGRMINSGQTCVAPDYILAHSSIKDKLIRELGKARKTFMGDKPEECKDYARMVNTMHFDRVVSLMKGGKIVVGGETNRDTKFIAPTVLDDVDIGSSLMTDEIFGPLLPVIPYEDTQQVLTFINRRPKPLALYIFSKNQGFTDKILTHTSAGGVTVNDTLMHGAIATLPFGGVGESGMGAYHGKRTFDMFTHTKAVLVKQQAMEQANAIRYPPYTERKYNIMKFLLGKKETGILNAKTACACLILCAAVVWFVRFRQA